ncbi:MAG: glycosyltransferase family 2 protein [Acidobacteria bacterium]|nr:glycosyltransferase family 2 protein [Acidobacteriota bacterium]
MDSTAHQSAQIEVTAIVPAFNEENNIDACAEAICTALESASAGFELIFIDDGSSDATWQRIEACHRRDDRIKGLRLSRNFGKEAAILAGMESAKGQAILTLDADLQHPPGLIPEMIKVWRAGGVHIVDAVKRNRGGEPLLRRLSSRIYNRLALAVTGVELENSSDFKLLDRDVAFALLGMSERRRFYRGMSKWTGFSRASVEFDVPSRTAGNSKWTTRGLAWMAWETIVSYSAAPLRIIHVASVSFLVLAVALSIRAMQLWLTGRAVSGFTTVILLILILGGLLLFCLAIIAEYIMAIYDEVKQRPHYLLRDRIE